MQAKPEYAEHMKTERQQEAEEESVVPSTNAVVYPWTVMIERLKRLSRRGKRLNCYSVRTE